MQKNGGGEVGVAKEHYKKTAGGRSKAGDKMKS